jgi:hypothetical protein
MISVIDHLIDAKDYNYTIRQRIHIIYTSIAFLYTSFGLVEFNMSFNY